MLRRPPRYTLQYTPCPYTTLVRSAQQHQPSALDEAGGHRPPFEGVDDAQHPDDRRGIDVLAARLVVEAHVAADHGHAERTAGLGHRSEEHTSELQSLMRISYAVFRLKKKNRSRDLS